MLFSLNKYTRKPKQNASITKIQSVVPHVKPNISLAKYEVQRGLSQLPNTYIIDSITFRTLALNLENFKSLILRQSLSSLFLLNPYNTTLNINNVDKLWTRLANIYVNDVSDVPSGYGKRLTFCTNDGYVFIDVSTFQPDDANTKHLNYSMITMNQSYYVKSSGDYQIINDDPIFNPESTSIDSMTSGTALLELCNIKCGSSESPIVSKTDLSGQSTNAITYQKMDIESTRKEYLMTLTQKYGWASRYSNSLYTPSYYVATQITGRYGYSIYVRLSLYLL